jgi:hypothetical protein
MILKEEVDIIVNLSLEETFNAFTIPNNYLKSDLVKSVRLLRPGLMNQPNTKGALREINLLLGQLIEEIPEAEFPNFMEYQFHEWPTPFPHKGGTMRFFSEGDSKTRVVWDSAFEVPDFLDVPLIPELLKTIYGFSLKALANQLKTSAERK